MGRSFALKQTGRFFLYFLFWLLFFCISKLFFLVYNYSLTKHLTLSELFGVFRNGLVMDASMAGYLVAIPGLLLLLAKLITPDSINGFVRVFTLLLLVPALALMLLDLGLFPHWGTRVNVSAFNYLDDPVAIGASITFSGSLLFLVLLSTLIIVFLWLLRYLLPDGLAPSFKPSWKAIPIQLLVLAVLFIVIRGGLDTAPLNLSSVAFSPKLYVNQAATNYLWNFAKSVEKKERLHNPCAYLPIEQSEQIFRAKSFVDSTYQRPKLLQLKEGKQPNVVLIILESFSNKVIPALGGQHPAAPYLDALCASSTVFTSFYAAGNRSDRGISAILGGYPSLMSTSIMIYPEKSDKLDLLSEHFEQQQYNTSFYYGGDINFYNLKSFVLQGKYDQIISKADFPSELGRISQWGVPDGYLFERALDDLAGAEEPFMKTIYTVSSHPPYDVPYSKIKGNTLEDKYLNSVAYTDSCLGVFIDGLKNSTLWDNTLVIITADHGALQPGPTDITSPDTYRVPLIWTGGVVDTLRRVETVAMQSDLATSLLYQLGWQHEPTGFNKDFFAANPFAFYMLEYGWGYITPEGHFFFDKLANDFTTIPLRASSESMLFAKAYLQLLHEDFKLK